MPAVVVRMTQEGPAFSTYYGGAQTLCPSRKRIRAEPPLFEEMFMGFDEAPRILKRKKKSDEVKENQENDDDKENWDPNSPRNRQ
mmetsp:Transcript_7826/g.9928  ORF Transcript_7826/g.9928 Transcript_7826/m.9928 type:complete len:85 (+) Transcript_7826:223-477(+)